MQHDYFHDSTAERQPLSYLAARCAKGLLSYERCSLHEVHRFIFDRRLSLYYGATLPFEVPFEKAVALLESADRHLVFRRLPDLNPGLQAYIFRLYLCSLPPLPERPDLPELAFVSKRVYAVVRPLFYTCCTFSILSIRLDPWKGKEDKDASGKGIMVAEKECTLRHYSKILSAWTPALKYGDQSMLSTIQRLAIDVHKLELVRRVLDPDRDPCDKCWTADHKPMDFSVANSNCRFCYEAYGGDTESNAPHARWNIDFGDSWRPVELKRVKRANATYAGEDEVGRENWYHYENNIWWGADYQENQVMARLEAVHADIASRWGDRKFEPYNDTQRLIAAVKAGYAPRVL
ncbi:hypothetical protein LTR95_008418 [Oleoguttula sp. CCFEE 5521]